MESPLPVPPQGSPEGASLAQVLIILRRRWRLLALVWIAVVVGVGIYTFTTERLYRPQATLEIRPETPLVGAESNDPALMASRMMWENYYRTQEQILTSPSLLEATYKALPEAVRKKWDGRKDPVKAFAEQLDIEKVRSTFILKVGFVDAEGRDAMQVVNTLVNLYLEDANRRLRDLKSGAAEVLSKETLPSIRARVDDADKSLLDFQAKTGFVDFEEHYKLLVEARRKLDARLVDIRLKRVKTRAELDALSGYGQDGVSGLYNAAFHQTQALIPLSQERARVSAELAKAEKLYKAQHPVVQELLQQLRSVEGKIREAIAGALKALETDLAAVEGEEKALQAELKSTEKAMGEAANNLYRYKRLDGEFIAAKELYNSYLKRHGETAATSSSSLGSVRVVDWATEPKAPFKPKILVNLGLAAAVGLLLGVAAMFVVEQLDDRIASPREVEAFVGLEVLSMIPRLSTADAAGKSPALLGADSGLPEFEAFRGLRAELVTRLEKVKGPKVVCILSALASEGKSTVTANLSRVLAMERRKVLILDADLRRPSQTGLIGNGEGPGLEAYLKGEATIEAAVRPSTIPGVDLLGAREGSSGAAELAGLERFDEALAWSRERYDYVLIDSAPVNQVSESPLVARRADMTLLVVREGQTGRSAAALARRRLEGLGVALGGVVLNCAHPQGRGYGYGYGYYYSSYYGRA
jgi:capsular exopolysaccharide synthesis family protein